MMMVHRKEPMRDGVFVLTEVPGLQIRQSRVLEARRLAPHARGFAAAHEALLRRRHVGTLVAAVAGDGLVIVQAGVDLQAGR